MICRKAVICCELRNGVSYVNRHGETGLVVPPRAPSALTDAINCLLDDAAQRKALGAAGRLRVEREFTMDHMWSGTLSVYREIMS